MKNVPTPAHAAPNIPVSRLQMSSLQYGGGTFLAFLVPWLLLPEAWFIGVVLFYLAAATVLFLVICGLGVWQDLQPPVGQI
jgi:hypothetical protein